MPVRRIGRSSVQKKSVVTHCCTTSEIKLDPGFKDFLVYCRAHDVPVVIVSSGMVPIIRGTSLLNCPWDL